MATSLTQAQKDAATKAVMAVRAKKASTPTVAPNANLSAAFSKAGINTSESDWRNIDTKSGQTVGYMGDKAIGVLNKIADKNKIVSSSSALDARDTNNAMNTAGNGLDGTTGLGNTPTGSFYDTEYWQGLQGINTSQQESWNNLIKATELSFDSKLAQQNYQYAEQFKMLEGEKNKALQIAASNAAALNPYSQARGAQTAANFSNKIVQNYNDQARSLQQQADLARQALASGETEAYAQIQKNMADSNNKFVGDMMNMMMRWNEEQTRKQEFAAKYNLDVAELQLSEDRFMQDRYEFEVGSEQWAIEQDFRERGFNADEAYRAAQLGIDYAQLEMDRERLNLDKQLTSAQILKLYNDVGLSVDADGNVIEGAAGKSFKLEGWGTDGNNLVFTPRKNLTVAQQNKIGTVLSATEFLSEAERLYSEAVGGEYGGFGTTAISRLKGLARSSGMYTGVGPNPQAWTAYINYVNSNKAVIAKGIKGEVGNLATQEQDDAIKSLPTRFSTPQEAETAFRTVKEQMLANINYLGDVVEETGEAGATANNPGGI